LELLAALGNPIISTSAHLPPDEADNDMIRIDPEIVQSRVELFDRLDKLVDIIIDTGEEPTYQVSTILDMTEDKPVIIRRGLGWEAAAAWV
jgi:tRNA A37 threonylcarbamoyladenosine synthetase subunit TsaC/SUA5/YrdC